MRWHPVRGLPAIVGALALTGGYLVVHLVSPAAMGAGDVKLAIGLGALTGAFGVDAWIWAALGAPLLTALWGLLRRRRVLPHGPPCAGHRPRRLAGDCRCDCARCSASDHTEIARIYVSESAAWEDGTRVAMDHCW